MEQQELKINLNILFNNSLRLEQYYILYCICFNKERELIEYTSKCGKILTEFFISLETKGFLNIKDKNDINFDSIKLTEAGEQLFITKNSNIKQDFLRLFEELKTTYPSSVMNDLGKPRRLLGDLDRCKKLYMNTLLIEGTLNEDLHKNILKAVKLYAIENGKYTQAMSAFLQQKTWEQYLELIQKNIDINITTSNNYDAV